MDKIKQLFWFGVIGVIGFVVDSGLLYAVKGWAGLYGGRAISFFGAVLVTWLLNKNLTFRHSRSGKSTLHEAAIYFSCMLSGGAVNYLTYWLLVGHYSLVSQHPILGVAAGSLTGMVCNFLTAKLLVFKHQVDTHHG